MASALLCESSKQLPGHGHPPDLPGAAPPWPHAPWAWSGQWTTGHSLSPGPRAGPVRLRWLPGSEVGILPEEGTVGWDTLAVFLSELLLPMHILARALGNGADPGLGFRPPHMQPLERVGALFSAPLQRGHQTG